MMKKMETRAVSTNMKNTFAEMDGTSKYKIKSMTIR
jgi:hypothetical protein